MPVASASPISRRSAGRSWVRATARSRTTSSASSPAPAELYYHQNPGGAVEQMVSASSQQPYTSLKSAWRYRKEFVQGCSCKAAEYQPPAGGDKKAEVPAAPGGPSATARLNTK